MACKTLCSESLLICHVKTGNKKTLRGLLIGHLAEAMEIVYRRLHGGYCPLQVGLLALGAQSVAAVT
jgi:hypothetical protein